MNFCNPNKGKVARTKLGNYTMLIKRQIFSALFSEPYQCATAEFF